VAAFALAVGAPANGSPIRPETAGMRTARRDGRERSCGRRTLAIPIFAPTGDRSLAVQRTCVAIAGRDLGKHPFGWDGLAAIVFPPTAQRLVLAHSANMLARAHIQVVTARQGGVAETIAAQHATEPSVRMPQAWAAPELSRITHLQAA